MLRSAEVSTEDAQAADEDGHFGSGEGEQLGAVDEEVFSARSVAEAEVVAEAVCGLLERSEGGDVGLLLRRVGATGGERHGDVVASFFRRCFNRDATAEDDEI